MSRATTMRQFCLGQFVLLAMASLYAAASSPTCAMAFSSMKSTQFVSPSSLALPTRSMAPADKTTTNKTILKMSTSSNNNNHNSQHAHHPRTNDLPSSSKINRGRKRAILKKYGKAIAISTTLLYGPMASAPFLRRSFLGGSTAHAASSAVAPDDGSYNFQDFKDVKKKLSLAPGANVQEYTDILAKVEVEGEEALKEFQKNQKETAALTIGGTGSEGDSSAGGGASSDKGNKQRGGKRAQKKQAVSEWESDEFGFGEEDDDDEDGGVLSFGGSSASSRGMLGPSKKGPSSSSSSEASGVGDVIVTDRMAFNKYKEADSQEVKMKKIKKGAFYSIFPVFVITMIRGQVRAYKEKKWVKKGLAIVEEERKQYLEEKRQGKHKKDDDDDDDDDEDDDE